MRIRPLPSRRGGFTLIELLVVVSILAILAGLTLAGISRVRSGQNRATTEGTVKKLQVGLENQMTASNEESTKESNPYLPAFTLFCDGDKDRAKAILSYANAKRNFPQTFAEARTLLTLPGVGAFPAHKAFAKIPAGASGLTVDQESAVLLYIIVTEQGNKGASSTGDAFANATMAITSTTGVQYQVFKDGYGTHLAFVRWYGANSATDANFAEVQGPPFANPKDQAKYGSVDKFDPLGKLKNWGNAFNKGQALTVLNSPAGSPPVLFDGYNKLPTVVSAGPDKAFGTGDEIYGYPLARFGAKGD